MKSRTKHLEDRVAFLEWQTLEQDNRIAGLVRENELLWELLKCVKSKEDQV